MIGSYAVAKKYLSEYSTTIRKYDYIGYVFQNYFVIVLVQIMGQLGWR